MKIATLIFVPFFLYAHSLSSLLESANKNNEYIMAKKSSSLAQAKELQSAKSSYLPTLDVGALYQRSDEPNPFSPGTIASAYAKVGYNLYDGGKKGYIIGQKSDELKATQLSTEATSKSIELSIVQKFYTIKTLEASLRAEEESAKAVNAQLERVKKFLLASLATEDDLYRLQAAYEKNSYAIESIKLNIYRAKKELSLLVGTDVTNLEGGSFKKIANIKGGELDSTKAMRATENSIINRAKQLNSNYKPQIRVEDTFNVYGYMDKPSIMGKEIEQLDYQNKIMATLNIRLYDFNMLTQKKEALLLQAKALNQEIRYKNREQRMLQELSLEEIKTTQLQIKSALSALKASQNALTTITKKYNSGIVDNVIYLNALSSQTQAKSMYEASLNNLEVAYARYYYYNNKKLGDYL